MTTPRTPLAEFLSQTDLTQTELGARWGIDNSYLSRLASGKRKPSLFLARLIERDTNGAVPVDSWPLTPRKGWSAEEEAA